MPACYQFPLSARLTEHGAVTAVRGMIVVGPVGDGFHGLKARGGEFLDQKFLRHAMPAAVFGPASGGEESSC